jgi:hypothetical protein
MDQTQSCADLSTDQLQGIAERHWRLLEPPPWDVLAELVRRDAVVYGDATVERTALDTIHRAMIARGYAGPSDTLPDVVDAVLELIAEKPRR